MNEHTPRFRPGTALAALAALLLSACATTDAQRGDDIATRAQARWDTLLSGDLAGAYEYLSPGYRSSVSSLAYQRKILTQRVNWTAARYIDSECLESSCKVRISVDYLLIAPVAGVQKFDGTQVITESWVRVDGQWWLLPEK